MRKVNDQPKARLFGNAREKAIKDRGGYTSTPGSGSSGVKGDLRRGDFMVEVKAPAPIASG